MDPINNQPTAQSQNNSKHNSTAEVSSADMKVKNVFADAIGVVQLSEDPDSIYHYFVASPMYAGFGDLANPERISFLQGLNGMSPGLRNYFTSADTAELIFTIGENFELSAAQTSLISILIRDLILGNIFIKDFPIAISSKLGIDDIKAGEMANNIITSFGPIIEDIKRTQRTKFGDKISQMQQAARPSTLTQPTARPLPTTRPPTPAQAIRPPSQPIKTEVAPPEEERPLGKSGSSEVQSPKLQPPLNQSAGPQSMRPRPLGEARPEGAAPQPAAPPAQQTRPVMPSPVQVPTPTEAAGRGSLIAPQSGPAARPQPPMRPITKPVLPKLPPELSAAERMSVPGLPQHTSTIDLDKANGPTNLSGIKLPSTQAPSNKAEKSLEAELEKVGNLIDLRSKPKDK